MNLQLYDWRKQFSREGLTPMLRLELHDLLTPKVRLSPRLEWPGERKSEDLDTSLHINDLVDWEIVLTADYVDTVLRELEQEARWHEALPHLLSDVRGLLRDALDLMRELDGAGDRSDRSYIVHPSIGRSPQNRHFADWSVLIDLTRDSWLATAEVFPDRARAEVEYWLTSPYPVFRRLAFFAATETRLFSPQHALTWLLADDHWWLWSVETQREVIRLLVALATQLASEQSDVLQQAILRGPPQAMFRSSTEPERLLRIADHEIWLRLAKYRDAGGVLSPDAVLIFEALSQERRLAEDERDEFPVWMGNGDDWRTFQTTPKQRRDLEVWLREHPTNEMWHEDDWGHRCKYDFPRTATALLHLAKQGEWITARWREALQAWSEPTLAARSWRFLSRALVIAPHEVIQELTHVIGYWLQSLANTFHDNEDGFFFLIRRILVMHRDETAKLDNDVAFGAINHPVGFVTQAALSWWYRQGLQDGQGLRTEIEPIFTEICDPTITAFRYGRVLLGANVITLFRVDTPWTIRNLLPLFDWRSPDEARAAWVGFLWSPRLYAPLIEAIKFHFLATAEHYEHLGDHAEQYAGLLTFASLEPDDTFSRLELAYATASLPADGLAHVAQTLVNALDSAGEQRV